MRAVLAAVAAGLVAGAVVAAAQDDPTRAPARELPPITEAPAREPRGRLPDGRYDPGYSHYLVQRPRIVATIEDPDGEPAWAIRTFLAERRTIRRPARTLDDYAFRQAYRCVELGRILNGRFGWVHGDRRFRPHEPTAIDQLMHCTSRRRPQAVEQRTATLAFRSISEPRLDQGVVWGLAPPGARSVTLGAGRLDLHGGAFLGLVDPTLRTDRIRYGLRDGSTEVSRLERVPRLLAREGEPVPGSARIEARAPDPAGGAGWGVLVADRIGGGTCLGGAAQVVGDHSGGVDTDLALFHAFPTASIRCRPEGEGPTPRMPLWPGYGWGVDVQAAEQDAFLRRARIERRVLPGRFQLVIECHPSVERVTIRSPRDIRTLVPSERGHVVFALYDGHFSAGELVLIATMRGGGRFVQRLPLGF